MGRGQATGRRSLAAGHAPAKRRMLFRSLGLCVLAVTLGLFMPCLACGRERTLLPLREAFVVESDGNAEKKLAVVADYVAERQWSAALSLLREVSTANEAAFIRLSAERSVGLGVYCEILRSQLPREALILHRSHIDPQANAWLAEADQTGSRRPLRLIVERAFLSSAGDVALNRLAERAWEEGDIAAARRYWTSLLPLTLPTPAVNSPNGSVAESKRVSVPVPPGMQGSAASQQPEALPAVLRYPDTELDLAVIRAQLLLCRIAEGDLERAHAEFAAYQLLHANAHGHAAGREGRLATILAEELDRANDMRSQAADAAAEPTGSPTEPAHPVAGQGDWQPVAAPRLPGTYLGDAARRNRTRLKPEILIPQWSQPLPVGVYASGTFPPALIAPPPLSSFPVAWHDKRTGREYGFVANAYSLYAFDLQTGAPAWLPEESPTPLPRPDLEQTASRLPEPLYTRGEQLTAAFTAAPWQGSPHYTLSVGENVLFARLGPPVTSWPIRELSLPENLIDCIGPHRGGTGDVDSLVARPFIRRSGETGGVGV